jgi:citrate lyase beta subunit
VRIRITKGAREDRIDVERADGSSLASSFPHKGFIPHDAVHFHTELGLGIADGFWGKVAAGQHPDEIAALAKAAGHASASRRRSPDADFVAAIQAERLVECFEADLWSGGDGEVETFIATAEVACEHSFVPSLSISPDQIEQVRAALAAFLMEWRALAIGQGVELEWPDAGA